MNESMNNIKREGEQIGYFITFSFKEERTLEADFSDFDQNIEDETDPNYCKTCQSSPCECSDPERTSTVV